MASPSPHRTWLVLAALLAVPAGALVWWSWRTAKESPPKAAPEPSDHALPRGTTEPRDPDLAPAPAAELPSVRQKADLALRVQRTDPMRRRQLLRDALVLDPKDERALAGLSLAMLHDETHDEARELAARCLAVSPDNEVCRMVSSYALPRTPEAEAVAAEARACLGATPGDPKCLATTIGHDVLEGKLDEATALTDELERVAPGAKQTLLARARIESRAGHYEEARRALDGACRQGMEQACFRADALREEGW